MTTERTGADSAVDRLSELLEEATPGPWASGGDQVYAGSGETYSDICRMLQDWGDPDAALIAAARNALPTLLHLAKVADRIVREAEAVRPFGYLTPMEAELSAALAALDSDR